MQTDVPQKTGLVRERLATRIALVWLDAGVQQAVRPHRRQMQEPLVADFAGVARVALVYGCVVSFQCGNVGERSLAFWTYVGPLASVNRHVLLQVAELRELTATHVAGEGSNVSMQIHVYLPMNNNNECKLMPTK